MRLLRKGGHAMPARIAAIDNAIDILMVLSQNKEKSIRELGGQLDISKSTLHRTLQTLESRGFVKQDSATQKYSLGYQILELGVQLKAHHELRNAAVPHMVDLRDRLGETVQLAVMENDQLLIIEAVEGTKELRFFSKAGQTLPVTYGNFGKVFLAFMDIDERENYLAGQPLEKYGSLSIVDRSEYIKQLEHVKEERLSKSVDDPIDGSISMAVPIFSKTETAAALSIVGAKTNQLLADQERWEKLLKKAGEAVSNELSKT